MTFVALSGAALLYMVYLYVHHNAYHHIGPSTKAPIHRAWSRDANRDTTSYILPQNSTTVHEPNNVCTDSEDQNKRLFLLIEIHSTAHHFSQREAIRGTYGSYDTYLKMTEVFYNYRKNKNGTEEPINVNTTESDYKVIFLLGMPDKQDSPAHVQKHIDDEAAKHGDILQQNFTEAYQNLTIKSVMMLKWVTNKCGKKVRYVLKTDDDVFVNLPYLINHLKKKAQEYDSKAQAEQEEYLLTGNIKCNVSPNKNFNSRLYSPTYMYDKQEYPCYAIGWGYVMSYATVSALYNASLATPLFHLEDIYITGMCREKASLPLEPEKSDVALTYNGECDLKSRCILFKTTFCHGVPAINWLNLTQKLVNTKNMKMCLREEELAKSENEDSTTNSSTINEATNLPPTTLAVNVGDEAKEINSPDPTESPTTTQ